MSTVTEPTPPGTTQPGPQPNRTLADAGREYLTRVRGGDVGALPAILGLVVLLIVFTSMRPSTFANAFNVANLINQSAAVIVIAMGLVFVLLLGEIDLCAGFTAGTAASVMGVVLTNHGWDWRLSIVVCLATGAVIGTCIGLLVANLGIPSFVVTLAAFLGLQGLMLVIIGEGGTISFVQAHDIIAINTKNLPVWLGWVLCIGGLAVYAAVGYRRISTRRAAGLSADLVSMWAAKTGALAVILIAATAYLSGERSRNVGNASIKGVPIVVVVIAALLVLLNFVLSRTAWGQHVYAVGGNAEAARRAGINVARVRLSCFVMCSTVSAGAGILLVSRDSSVSPTTGGQTTLLFAVGAAVIGGTSLFGGKGRVADAIIGGLVIAVINNGMLLLEQPSGRIYMVTGLVLLLAASVDAISRRRAAATGRG
jgi:D-xylose transport system permease protein